MSACICYPVFAVTRMRSTVVVEPLRKHALERQCMSVVPKNPSAMSTGTGDRKTVSPEPAQENVMGTGGWCRSYPPLQLLDTCGRVPGKLQVVRNAPSHVHVNKRANELAWAGLLLESRQSLDPLPVESSLDGSSTLLQPVLYRR